MSLRDRPQLLRRFYVVQYENEQSLKKDIFYSETEINPIDIMHIIISDI